MPDYFVGVDVGTGSVRAALVDGDGCIISVCVVEIKTWSTKAGFYEQSSDNIWKAAIKAIKDVTLDSQVDANQIVGLGFDATCSLVVLDGDQQPLTVTTEGDNERNIILWMDHRAHKEADEINNTRHEILDTVGGTMSLEMQLPKLLWLKKNLSSTWNKAKHFMDLPDYLTWKATGSLSRSSCSLGCKWTYQTKEDLWNEEFLALIGLEDLAKDKQKIGTKVKDIGSKCGGVNDPSLIKIGFVPGTAVSTSVIDAHCGALGCLSCHVDGWEMQPLMENTLVMIAGTSNCHIVCSNSRVPVKGVWGPYYNAMVPGMWVNEGGQSAAGSLIDYITNHHAAFPEVKQLSQKRGIHPYIYLNGLLNELTATGNHPNVAFLTRHLHVWPDFHGNRSPLADPSLRGMISGLDLSTDKESLAFLYLASIQAIAYGTKLIVNAMTEAGLQISTVFVCGGLSKNSLFIQTQADVLGLPIVIPNTDESILLGAAILGMCASGKSSSLQDAMTKLGGSGTLIHPNKDTARYHSQKFTVFKEMLKDQRKYSSLMTDT